MTLLTDKLLMALLIFLTSIVSVVYPLKIRAKPTHNHFLERGDAFASGIFLGAALFHMLPDATQEFAALLGQIHYPVTELCCALGFLVLLFFERLSSNAPHSDQTLISYVIAAIIIIHSLIEGTALGVNTTFATTAIIFLAIMVHKSSESFMLAVTLNRTTLRLRQIILIISLFAMMTPIGIAIGTSITLLLASRTEQWLTAIFNAFAAGTFLYMSTLHHINHHQRSHRGEGLIEFMAIVIGLVIMAGLALLA